MANHLPPGANLPNWLRWAITAGIAVVFFGNVYLDYTSATYDGQYESLIIGSLLGAALGFDKIIRRGGGGDDQ